jgi:hypothetical protein
MELNKQQMKIVNLEIFQKLSNFVNEELNSFEETIQIYLVTKASIKFETFYQEFVQKSHL